jgi:hypothetical protein
VTLAVCLLIFAEIYLLKICCEISNNVKKSTEQAQANTALQYQTSFGQHVDDFAASRVRHAKDETEAKKAKEKTSNSDYFFIYHPSTNWHASFEALQSQKTFTNIVAVCHRIDVLEKEIRKLRKSIGPEPKIYILMPSLHKYDLNEGLALDQSLLPFIFEGELGFLTEPYVTLNVPQLNDSHFYRI